MKKLLLFLVVTFVVIAGFSSVQAQPLSGRLDFIQIAYDARYSEIPEMPTFGPVILAEASFLPGVTEHQIRCVIFTHVPTKVSYRVREGSLITEEWGVAEPILDYGAYIGRGPVNALGKWRVTVVYTHRLPECHLLHLTSYETPPPPTQVHTELTEEDDIMVRWFANCGTPGFSSAGYRIRIWDENGEMVHQVKDFDYNDANNTVTFLVPEEYSGYKARLENRLYLGGAALDGAGERDAGWSRACLWIRLP